MKRRYITHCPSNHEYTPENTYIQPCDGRRRCKECRRVRDQERDQGRVRPSTALPPEEAEARMAAGRAKAAETTRARVKAHVAAVIEDVEFMLDNREHPDVIARRVGYKRPSLVRLLQRNGRLDLARLIEVHAQERAA